jgi:hypothetical protein
MGDQLLGKWAETTSLSFGRANFAILEELLCESAEQ